MSNAQHTASPVSDDSADELAPGEECPICFRDAKQVTCAGCPKTLVVYDCNCWYDCRTSSTADGVMHRECADRLGK